MNCIKFFLGGMIVSAHSMALDGSFSDDLLGLSLEDLMQVKIVSSTLTEKNLRTVPSSVTVFSRGQIDTMGIDTLEELLNFVPGFQSFRQAEAANAYYHSVRGRRTGTSSREVLILLDGQRFQDEFFADIAIYTIPLTSIEKVEVIRGPGSAIYGSNAFTGVINITTRKNTNALSLQFGGHNNALGQILYSTKINDISVNACLHLFSDDGMDYHLENTATRLRQLYRDPSQGYDINVQLEGETAKLSVLHYSQVANEFYVAETFSPDLNEYQKKVSAVQFVDTLTWTSLLSTTYKVSYKKMANLFIAPIVPPNSRADFTEDSVVADINNSWQINEKNNVQFGVEAKRLNVDKAVLFTDYGDFLVSDAYSRTMQGIYLQSQTLLAENTELTLGVRYDNYLSIGASVSPRFGLTHQFFNSQTVKLLYGEAFRAPAVGELIFSNNNAVIGNSHLKPELIKTWELVWMGNWQHHSLTVTAFDSSIEYAIVQGFVGQTRQFVNAKLPENSQGIEIEYIAQLAPNWQLRAQYSLFNSLPESSFRQTDNLASLIVNYQHEKWNFNLSAQHAGEREMLSGSQKISLHDYWLANGKVQYQFKDGATLYLQVKNMFNEQYLTPTQGVALTQGIPNRGREWSLGLNWAL